MRFVVFLLVFQTVYQQICDLLTVFGVDKSTFKDLEQAFFSRVYNNPSFEIDDAPKVCFKVMKRTYDGLSFAL